MSSQNWPTKSADMAIAFEVLGLFTDDIQSLTIFELTKQDAQKQTYQLAPWVFAIDNCFNLLYGEDKGEAITKKIVSELLINGEKLH